VGIDEEKISLFPPAEMKIVCSSIFYPVREETQTGINFSIGQMYFWLDKRISS
jgi:hypothetical protein